MSVSPDPVTAPGVPSDPAAYRRRPFGLGLWTLLALCLLCVLAGAGVARLLPRFLPDEPAPPRAAPATPEPAVPLVTAQAEPFDADEAEIQRLQARIAALESQGARTTEAAAAAVAAAALIEASQTSRPFAAELAALRRLAPDLPELAALSRVAAEGAPTRAALAAQFPAYAARAASAARLPGPDAKLEQRVIYAFSRVVSVRRVSRTEGDSPDARLARAEAALEEGDVPAALKALDGLPEAVQESLAAWRAEAERRAEIDRAAARLKTRALRDLRAAGAVLEVAA